MPKFYSYVVEHDYGRSPNPTGGFCTLAFCKFNHGSSKKRNIVELAEKDDWVIGTGGSGPLSAGHGKLVYAMRVTEKLTLQDYFRDSRFVGRAGNNPDFVGRTDMFALISEHYFYFGASAPKFTRRHANHPIEKRGPSHRSRFPEEFVTDFVKWLEKTYQVGLHGNPCAVQEEPWPEPRTASPPRCSTRRSRSVC